MAAKNRTLFCSATLMQGPTILKEVHFRIHVLNRVISERILEELGLSYIYAAQAGNDQTWVIQTANHPRYDTIYTRELLVAKAVAPQKGLTICESERFVLTVQSVFMRTLTNLLAM